MTSLSVTCLLLLAVLPLCTPYSQITSHYVTKYRFVKVLRYRYRCYTWRTWVCWWWRGWHRTCYHQAYYTTVRQSYRACATGYRGRLCNIPICTPPCGTGGICTAVNHCDCPSYSQGDTCQIKKCSWATDCYPGICKSDVTCECSSEFEGDNCEKMKDGPMFRSCFGSIIDRRHGRNDFLRVNCSFYDEPEKVYTNMRDFTNVQLEWEATYTKLSDLPSYPKDGFVRTFRVGVIDTKGDVLLKDTSGKEAYTTQISCLSGADWKNPQETIQCTKESPFNEGITHGQELIFTMTAKTGGFKDIRNQDTAGTYKQKEMEGQTKSLKAYIVFDIEPPFHCTEGVDGYPCEYDDMEPVLFDSDVTRKPNVTVLFLGWNDTDSGVRGYTYEVYQLKLNSMDRLQNNSVPVLRKEHDLFSDEISTSFLLPSPGLYSFVGGVHDFANNVRYVRRLVLYADPNSSIETTDVPLTISPGPVDQMIDRTFWLSDLSQTVKLKWGGHFANQFVAGNGYDKPVASLPNPYIECSGNISANGSPSIDGIKNLSTAVIHKLQSFGSRRRRELPDSITWKPVQPLKDEVELNELNGRQSGDSYTVFMKVEDVIGNQLEDYVFVRIDNTRPLIGSGAMNFVKSAPRKEEGFFSSVDVHASEYDGALHSITFTLYDIENPSDPRKIASGIQLINETEQDKDACLSSGRCLCTKERECYDNPLKLYLNNCWFLNYIGVQMKLDIVVNNRVGLSENMTYDLGRVSNLPGIGEYPKPLSMRVKDAFGYTVVLTWYLPASCYQVRLLNLELSGAKEWHAVISADKEELEITNLVPHADYTARLKIEYEGRKESEALEINFNTGDPPANIGYSICGAGCIVGIIIGVLVLAAIVSLTVVIAIRLRRQQAPLPDRLMHPVNRLSRRFGFEGWDQRAEDYHLAERPPSYKETVKRTNAAFESRDETVVLNVSKLGDFEEDIYTYGEMSTDAKAKWKHSGDQVIVGKTLNKGRFAEIKEGQLKTKTGTRKVAIKTLLDRSAESILLMRAKMNFLATAVPHHNNIVNFVGAVPDGPIILLELCEQTLRDWLKNREKITDEVEDSMIDFCTDIARGMGHLHANGILHRRLGARNVLLKHVPEMFRIVAKITGFGPMSCENSSSGVNSDKERIPIKWMALEQLGIEEGKTRPYTNATDVWSFGVTAWEIFSKGATPFANVRSTEVRALLENGMRLEQPSYASHDLYEKIMMKCWQQEPEKRPTFQQLVNDLVELFNGSGGGDMYYDDAPKSSADELYDNGESV